MLPVKAGIQQMSHVLGTVAVSYRMGLQEDLAWYPKEGVRPLHLVSIYSCMCYVRHVHI